MYHFQERLGEACEITGYMYSCALLKISQYFKTYIEIINDSKAKSFKQRFPFKIIDFIFSISERKLLVSNKEFRKLINI